MSDTAPMICSPPVLVPNGTYYHHKGGHYVAIVLADRHTHNGDKDVLYFSLDRGRFYTRPFCRDSRNEDSWTDDVLWPDGVTRPRFVHDSGITSSELMANAEARTRKDWNGETQAWESRT